MFPVKPFSYRIFIRYIILQFSYGIFQNISDSIKTLPASVGFEICLGLHSECTTYQLLSLSPLWGTYSSSVVETVNGFLLVAPQYRPYNLYYHLSQINTGFLKTVFPFFPSLLRYAHAWDQHAGLLLLIYLEIIYLLRRSLIRAVSIIRIILYAYY